MQTWSSQGALRNYVTRRRIPDTVPCHMAGSANSDHVSAKLAQTRSKSENDHYIIVESELFWALVGAFVYRHEMYCEVGSKIRQSLWSTLGCGHQIASCFSEGSLEGSSSPDYDRINCVRRS